jgi:hypothetical protein
MDAQAKYWRADVRVLVLGAPPLYIKVLVEVPKAWILPADGVLPEQALDAVKNAVRSKYPRCPITPAKLGVADAESLKRTSGQHDFSNAICKVWLLGRAASA